MILIAIDPGAISGAYAIRYHTPRNSSMAVGDLPTADGQINAHALAEMIRSFAVSDAVAEAVSAMPGQGVSSMFKFGVSFGIIRGVLATLKVPTLYVVPSKWKRDMALLGKQKEECRAIALERHPEVAHDMGLKKHHGRAEALLLSDWYLQQPRSETAP